MSCPAPHPVRIGGLELSPELEIIGGHGSEVWARCRSCDAWFWTSTDIGSKYEYVGDVKLAAKLAERAFIDGDVDAMAELLVTYRIPHGPVWTTASSLVELFTALTPGVSNAARAQALAAQSGSPQWARAAQLFTGQARGEAAAPPRKLAFPIDLALPGDRRLELHEVGGSLVLLTDGQSDLFRLDAARLVQLPLAGPPRLLARRSDAIVLAIATPAGDATLVLDGAGHATAFSPTTTRYDVSSLDDGWWQFVPHGDTTERYIELHQADGSPRVKVPRRFGPAVTSMPPARRLASGWIMSNLIDNDGSVQALTLFDDQFKTAAFSTGITGERTITPIDAGSFWAECDGELERWVVRGRSLERVASQAMRWCSLSGDRMIVDHPDGNVLACGPDGRVLWTWQRETTGAAYCVVTSAGILLHDDDTGYLLDRGGSLVRTFDVEFPQVCVGSSGTVYVKTTDRLWIVRGSAHAIEVPLASRLEATCGDRALLSLADGWFWLVGPDGARAAFSAPGATFSVFSTVGGPYLVERGRLRVAAFAPG